MKNKRSGIIVVISLLIIIVLFAYFIPPENVMYIGFMIILASLIGMRAVAVFTGDRTVQILAAVFTAIFLSLQATIGFNVLNTILLASFIIGIGIFTKQ